jgi:hypothetical protein
VIGGVPAAVVVGAPAGQGESQRHDNGQACDGRRKRGKPGQGRGDFREAGQDRAAGFDLIGERDEGEALGGIDLNDRADDVPTARLGRHRFGYLGRIAEQFQARLRRE